ncbi:hypothetical protein [Terribacillus saccharophilus]|uniref:hypothetical protein n=1 Tax=Terribacillus saccharophilus TaxID=361277 RepID=UPI003D2AF267
MNFPIEIIKEVHKVAKHYARDNFIIGYRLMEQELHASEVGYTINDTLELVKKISTMNIDYIHSTTFKFGEEIMDAINGKTVFIVVPHVVTAQDAVEGLNYGDMISIGSAALIEPDIAKKIKEGRTQDIATEISSTDMAKGLKFPENLAEWMMGPFGSNYNIKGVNYFKDIEY